MTKKLFKRILTICLLFSSLNLTALADSPNAAVVKPIKSVVKKSPEMQFLEGEACLRASNIPCVKLSLALIPKISPYAKILEGALAFKQNQTDHALLLVLPIQNDDSLIVQAKILLHQTLAEAFIHLGDTQQAIDHLMRCEGLLQQSHDADSLEKILANHERIWRLISALNQSELITLRGNNTDNIFQGWIDLSLAAQDADTQNSIAYWNALYPEHPALNIASELLKQPHAKQTIPGLNTKGDITIVLPAETEVDAEKVQAFKLGLETALSLAGLGNTVKINHQQQATSELDAETDYFILPDFSESAAISHFQTLNDKPHLHIGLALQDEANTIFQFASKNSIQHVTIVTTQHETSQKMLASIQQAWLHEAKNDEYAAFNTITLDTDILAEPVKLLDLKSQIASKVHDMIILAMPAKDVVNIRPYLDISTPTVTFSGIHDIAYQNDALKLLNALRFVDMPFLLKTVHNMNDYLGASETLVNQTLLRWFALGADSLQLLITGVTKPSLATSIKGLAGRYSLSESGDIKRTLNDGRFNQSGAVPD